MKRFLLSFVTVLSLFTGFAQVRETDALLAKQMVNKHSAAIGLSKDDLNNYLISDSYQSPEGIRYMYLQQSYQGIPVFNQLQVLAFRNDKLVSNMGGRIRTIEKLINNRSAVPALSPADAVRATITECKLSTAQQILVIKDNNRKLEFGNLGISHDDINAQLIWVPVSEKEIKLAWQVFITPVNSDDMWLTQVDAFTGAVIGKVNLTVFDAWHKSDHSITANNNNAVLNNYVTARPQAPSPIQYRMPVVNSATYRVVAYPAESPTHPGGVPSIVINPWNMAPGNATSLKWHNDGTAEHDSTRGNNVWAAEDRNNTNNIIDRAAVSTTPQPDLTFDFVPDFTVAPTTTTPPNQQFNITNLFYWNNIVHDITYLYGFDEVSGNFQNNNQGRGGLGADYVIADAQDGGGTNNANFATPNDGINPRMQMYLWTAPNPDRDGDADNSIVVHEYGHGISNRLTGGPGNSSCLGNAENGGEGWSDYYGLMYTHNWASATPADGFNIPRGIGTYALGQPPNGPGIRNFRYCTNMAVNPLVYAASIPAESHNRGEIWCMVLWEMTWEMIQQTGINPNIFNPAGVGGNSAAIKLVTEAMKLQPCGPGFIDARNAILKADTLFFNSLYSCSIWKAFAKRGMGRNASQGSSSSVTDQIADYTVDNGFFTATQSVTAIPEGQNVTYSNHVTAGNCSPMTNFFVTDTLPTNVTYVSGGSYNAGNRTVTFGPINLTSGQGQTHPFTVTVNNGTYFAPVTHFNEQVTSATIPASWVPTPASGNAWTVSTTQGNSPPNSFFAPDMGAITDMTLANASSYTLNATVSSYTTLTFWHKFNTEDGWDGGVVEISTNDGATWSDLGSKIIIGKYNGSLGVGSNNPIGGRAAFTGFNGASFMKTVINLASFAGQSVRIRFRFASDDNTAPPGGGWWVDDIVLYTGPAVYMKSNLFNASSQLISTSDTITQILPAVPVCVPVTITTQPSVVNGCAGGNAVFTVVAAGTTPVYQWQVNTGSGFVNLANGAPYSGVTTATLTITGVTGAMTGYQYRCVLSNTCTVAFNSGAAALNVGAVAIITTQPTSSTVCTGVNTTFTIGATGATSYQWQVNTGSGFVDVTNTAPYSGATTATLTITGPAAGMTGYQYRCVLGSCGTPVNSAAATLTISVPVSITTQPANTSVCEGNNTAFTVVITGSASGFQWQISTDGGTTYANISGATTTSYNLAAIPVGMNGYRFRCIVTGACGPVTSSAGILTVNPLPVFSLGGGLNPAVICASDRPITLNIPAGGAGGTWSGTGVQGNSFNPSVAGVGATTLTFTRTSSGCTTAHSIIMQVNECKDRHVLLDRWPALIVYPNPNDGIFSIRVNTDLYTQLGMKIFNSDGQLLKTQQFEGIFYGSILPVDISRMPAGAYHLYLFNKENGSFISKGVTIILSKK
jgi:Fungalysin metallopeptidase (M36)/Secretion system C-terminal sorting domain/Fungalysin/Thermolysin Propeptide Motif/Domain of unknown function DUF11